MQFFLCKSDQNLLQTSFKVEDKIRWVLLQIENVSLSETTILKRFVN